MANGAASSLTEDSPCESLSRMARLVGLESAEKTRSRFAEVPRFFPRKDFSEAPLESDAPDRAGARARLSTNLDVFPVKSNFH